MNAAPREVELKFNFDHADDRRLKRYLSRAAGKRPINETLVSVYFDTPDFQFLARGISLRHTGICMRIILSEGQVNIFNLARIQERALSRSSDSMLSTCPYREKWR